MLTQLHVSFVSHDSASRALRAIRKKYRVALRGACVTGPDYHGAFGLHVPLNGAGFSNAELSAEMRQFAIVDTIAKHYIIAAIWADCPEQTTPRATRKALETARSIAAKFIDHIGHARMLAIESAHANGYGTHPDCGKVYPWAAAMGHDLFLTRAGHGVGFFDRDALPEDLREWLNTQCGHGSPLGSVETDFYRGWLYFFGE